VEPDDTLRELAARVARNGSWHYTPNAGNLSLRTLLAGNSGFDPKTEVCVTAGTEEAIFSTMMAFLDPGDEVLVPNPGFVAYPAIARVFGAEVIEYDLAPPGWDIDVDALLAKITPKTKVIVVNTPSNPLGAIVPRETLQRIADTGVLVICDQVYRTIYFGDEPPASMLGMGKNVIVVDGMSKSHSMTGLRLGWAIANERLMTHIVKSHQYIATCASAFAQNLAEEILKATEWNAQWLANVRSQFRTQRDEALHAIARELEAEIPPPPAAFYAFVPVPTCDTLGFAKTLATDAAVLVIPGIAFGSAGEGFIRISYAASVDQIGTGIERIGRWLRAAGR
jgi:aspartate/methionine/tyrosine aminotransferase